LPSYINELEWLFGEHGVTGNHNKINASLCYLPHLETHVWKSIESYSGATKSWAEFKDEVIKLYPGAAIEGQTTRDNLKALIQACATSVITSCAELGEYNRQFKVLADDLLQKH
ncbi:hypothetical protein PUNSTDRAFT_16500, partial [Punctularia strigosozonata HHB-11173 SS5]|uniref:uncharacterized protein n=1 Tax=Punctularia strigosozonata (strain HHB-11173) TaxID=741275 RepID=UPI000441827E